MAIAQCLINGLLTVTIYADISLSLNEIKLKISSHLTLTLKIFQIRWLNKYHDDCMKTVGAMLKADNKMEAYDWMLARTKPYEKHDHDHNVNSGTKAVICSALILFTALKLILKLYIF